MEDFKKSLEVTNKRIGGIMEEAHNLIVEAVKGKGGLLLTEKKGADNDSIYIKLYRGELVEGLACKGVRVKGHDIEVCLSPSNVTFTKEDLEDEECCNWYSLQMDCDYYDGLIDLCEMLGEYL